MKLSWKILVSVLVIILVPVGYWVASGFLAKLSPPLPPVQPVKTARWLNQNWRSADRYWFHHASQGTSTLPIPYRWFVSLAQPTLSVWAAPPLLIEGPYLQQMGFIPSPKSGQWTDPAFGYDAPVDPVGFATYGDGAVEGINPDGLPVGFAITKAYPDPTTGKPVPDQIGLTCAACHTGHLEYHGVSLRIDGANAAVSLDKLTTALGGALFLTDLLPWRFQRFADRVLGLNATDQDRDALHQQLKATLAALEVGIAAGSKVAPRNVEEGFNRLDALNRIGNTVFFKNLATVKQPGFDPTDNLAPLTAPVKFPHLWTTPWIDWVQYDGSILQPIIRNAGEAMGVNARVNMTAPTDHLWRSSVAVKTVAAMEHLIAGPYPLTPARDGAANGAADRKVKGFGGLTSPRWPEDVLGTIDPAKRDRGRMLYGRYCESCHLPPANEPGIYDPVYWTPADRHQERALKANLIDQSIVGTDPGEETILATRMVTVPSFLALEPGKTDPTSGVTCFTEPTKPETRLLFAQALASSVQKVVEAYFADHGIAADADTHDTYTGNRPNCVQAKPVYKARPLNGIWAVPPYLHNGSVPSLAALLGPVTDRPRQICLGNRAFDPITVGLAADPCPNGAFTLDTTIPGNSNRGHEFRDGPIGKDGVIGPTLSADDRTAIIEFLKSQ